MRTFEMQVYAPGERPEAFWQLAGPVFSSRAAQRELGGPFTDDARTTWVLALQGERLLGLASLHVAIAGERVTLDHAYVLPAERRQGVHAALLHRRLELAAQLGAQQVRVAANASSFPGLLKAGFVGSGQRGGYTLMELDGLVLSARWSRTPGLTLRE